MTKRLTLQQVFDNAVRGIYAQGEQAYDDGLSCCMYRQEFPARVLKCAIGHSIPDRLYLAEMEGMGPTELLYHFPALAAVLPDESGVLAELQSCHDDVDKSAFIEDFLSNAWRFASRHHLTWPEDVPRPD